MGRSPGEEAPPQFQQQQQQAGGPQQFPPQYAQQPQQFPPQFGQQPPQFPPQPYGAANATWPPPPALNVMPNSELWKTGLFDCMDDPMNAFITLFFPCITVGQVAEIVDSGQTSCESAGLLYSLGSIFTGGILGCIYASIYRTKLRTKYGLVESGAPDWLLHCFCDVCAMCQEYRELQHRGLDPSIGWLGNAAMKQQQQMVPPTIQRMMG